MNTKYIAGSIIIVGILIAVGIIGSSGRGMRSVNEVSGPSARQIEGVATLENGVQYVDITALGGYWPRTIVAKAGIPTIIRMKTENTYDCSLALVIPDIGHQSYLPRNGVKEIPIPLEKTQGTLRGMCSMAMYQFEIVFQ